MEGRRTGKKPRVEGGDPYSKDMKERTSRKKEKKQSKLYNKVRVGTCYFLSLTSRHDDDLIADDQTVETKNTTTNKGSFCYSSTYSFGSVQ